MRGTRDSLLCPQGPSLVPRAGSAHALSFSCRSASAPLLPAPSLSQAPRLRFISARGLPVVWRSGMPAALPLTLLFLLGCPPAAFSLLGLHLSAPSCPSVALSRQLLAQSLLRWCSDLSIHWHTAHAAHSSDCLHLQWLWAPSCPAPTGAQCACHFAEPGSWRDATGAG